jgi:hypothetical protein
MLAGALAATLVASVPAAADSTILTYHGALDRSGRYVMPGLTYERARGLRPDLTFNAAYRGEVYAQPLLWRDPKTGAGVLIVATEEDEVYAFDETTGAQIWMRTLGEPIADFRSAGFRCGDIWPLGVTGTPVIDKARATLYLDAMVMRDNHPRHEVYAVSLADGSVESGWPVDVATALDGSFDPMTQNQRGALALFGGRVFIPYSGLAGDCGVYYGRVIGFSTAEPGKVVSFSTRARAGGIWAQGGVTGDGKSLFAATGNTAYNKEWGDGEAVLRFGPDLARPVAERDYFAPSNWKDLDDHDLDLGSTAPIPLDVPSARGVRKLILAIGKDGNAYLLDRDNLGGVGGERPCDPDAGRRVPSHLERRRRRLCRARGGWRELPARSVGEGTSRSEDQRRPGAGDLDRLVQQGCQLWRRADRHHHRRTLGSDRLRPWRPRRQPALRLPGRHRRASRPAATLARHDQVSDPHRRRRQALCHRRRQGLRLHILSGRPIEENGSIPQPRLGTCTAGRRSVASHDGAVAGASDRGRRKGR